MAGYKRTVYNLKPQLMLTFDGQGFFDQYNGQFLHPELIEDKSGTGNHAIMIYNESDVRSSYIAGAQSLFPRESGDEQYSICFSPYSYDTVNQFPYNKSVLEVLHSETMRMDNEFTVMFMFNKYDEDTYFASRLYQGSTAQQPYTSGYQCKAFHRTIFKKGGVLGVSWHNTGCSSVGNYLKFQFPDHDFMIPIYDIIGGFYNVNIHVAMTRRKIKQGSALFKIVDTVYINGRIVHEKISDILAEVTSAFSTESLFIGGNADAVDYNFCNDRQTSPLYVDNFTLYSEKCLDKFQVADAYKKSHSYIEMIKRQNPTFAAEFAQPDILPDAKITNRKTEYGNLDLIYYGTNGQINTAADGPIRLMGSKSTRFSQGAMCSIRGGMQAAADWTLEFWAKFSSGPRGVIASVQTDYYPYKGILVEGNVMNNVERRGAVQISIQDQLTISTSDLDAHGNKINYADGKFHLYCVIRRGMMLEFWIDGSLIGTRSANIGNMYDSYGVLHLMGTLPGQLSIDGSVCMVSFQRFAEQEQMIRARAFFYSRMIIKGKITLEGSPHRANVRVFDHNTAELISEVESDPNTGEYICNTYSDNYLDVMVFDKHNSNIKYRAFGAVLANEYTDIDEVW